MHRSQVLFYVLSSFLVGVFVASLWFVSDSWLLGLVLAGAIVLAMSLFQKTFSQTPPGIFKRKLGALIGLLIIVTAFSF